jgi:hypothetical protein
MNANTTFSTSLTILIYTIALSAVAPTISTAFWPPALELLRFFSQAV